MEKCNNCGMKLTEQNIILACEDAGYDREYLIFCCPSYGEVSDPDTGKKYEACQGYGKEDCELPAYWRTA